MHPHIFERYGKVKQVAVIATSNGTRQDIASEGQGGKGRWWESFSPVKGHLLRRDQTPFIYSEFDTYELIKLDSAAR